MGHKHALDLCKKWLLSLKSKFLTEEMMFKFKFQRHLSSRSIAEVQGSSTIFYMSYYSSSARNCYSRNISVLNFKILLRIRWFRVRPALKFLALCYFHMRYIHLNVFLSYGGIILGRYQMTRDGITVQRISYLLYIIYIWGAVTFRVYVGIV